jgi:hypothetical protein
LHQCRVAVLVERTRTAEPIMTVKLIPESSIPGRPRRNCHASQRGQSNHKTNAQLENIDVLSDHYYLSKKSDSPQPGESSGYIDCSL